MAESFEKQRHNLTYAIGECILAWAKVEQQLAILFSEVMQKDIISGSKVFDSILSLEARLDLVTGAIKWFVPGTDKTTWLAHVEQWEKLREKILKKYKKRHEIAHCDLVTITTSGEERIKLLPFANIATSLAARFDLDNAQTILGESELALRRDLFKRLADEITDFRTDHLVASTGRPLEDPE